MHPTGCPWAWPYCFVEFAILQVGGGYALLFPEFCTLWLEWPCLDAKNLRARLWPIQFLAHCSCRRLRPEPSILWAAPWHSPTALGGAPQSIHCAAFHSFWPAGFSGHELLFESGLFVGRADAHVTMSSLLTHAPTPLFKEVPMWHSHCSSEPLSSSQCTLLPQKTKRAFLVRDGYGLPLPPAVLGARISLFYSPGWRCSYGHAAHCVCAAWASQTPYILPSLSRLG